MADVVFKVMVSSNFKELRREREAVRDAILGRRMLPLMMETDSAIPDRGIITRSLEMVTEADAYIVLISNYRYGQIISDPDNNPKGLSVTELEFERAEERGLPMCVYLMDEDVPAPISPAEIQKEAAWASNLNAFRVRAQHHTRIITEFVNVDDLKGKVIQTLFDLKTLLEHGRALNQDPITPLAISELAIYQPPPFFAKPPYTPGHMFQGRTLELAILNGWELIPDPVMIIEAIGGMGKSMVTWEWVTNHAAKEQNNWSGRLWYSFYDRGADMHDFKVTALAYMTGQERGRLHLRNEYELTDNFLEQLRLRRWLLVLDGMERILAAYHRSDAAQVQEDEIGGDTGMTGRQPRDCIRSEDERLLRGLPTAMPSKVLVSSRLMPLALLNLSGEPLPGVKHVSLHGLAPDDAEAMLTSIGIHGDCNRIRRYLSEGFEGHPLITGFIAGLIRKSAWARMDFDVWIDDPRGGATVNLADPDVRQRRTNILKLAFDSLEPAAWQLMARIGMLANPVGLDVLEALNPVRTGPPTEVENPAPLNLNQDDTVLAWRGLLSTAFDHKQREKIESQISARMRRLEQDHIAAREKYNAYETALIEWRRSPPLLNASNWLNDTLIDLDARGLLQWDRWSGTFDLHPVVRGYVVGRLDPRARGQAGQLVADYFSTQSEPDYDKVTSLAQMTDRLQMVRALNVAGKIPQAWDVLRTRMRFALRRLECYHELLALLRPLFPNGWMSSPSGVSDAELAATEAAEALWALGYKKETQAQENFAINADLTKGLSAYLSIRVRNNSLTLRGSGSLAQGGRALALARDIAAAIGDDQRTLWCDVLRMSDLMGRGNLVAAREIWSDMMSRSAWGRRDGQLEAETLFAEASLLQLEAALTPLRLHADLKRVHQLGWRNIERRLWRLLGTCHQAAGEHENAVTAFDQSLQMARATGLSDSLAAVQRGVSLARLGQFADAEAVAEAAERDPHHATMANLYFVLNRREKMRDHALAGYMLAWADGPPYCWYWDLQTCRVALQELGEPQPQLPPFALAKIAPLPYEADIRGLLADLARNYPS